MSTEPKPPKPAVWKKGSVWRNTHFQDLFVVLLDDDAEGRIHFLFNSGPQEGTQSYMFWDEFIAHYYATGEDTPPRTGISYEDPKVPN